MFRFLGHFAPPNNPEASPLEDDVGVHRSSEAVPVSTKLPATQADPIAAVHSPRTESSKEDAAITAAEPKQTPAKPSKTAFQHANAASQHNVSDFRRSHSPEWYDAKFRSYVLRLAPGLHHSSLTGSAYCALCKF